VLLEFRIQVRKGLGRFLAVRGCLGTVSGNVGANLGNVGAQLGDLGEQVLQGRLGHRRKSTGSRHTVSNTVSGTVIDAAAHFAGKKWDRAMALERNGKRRRHRIVRWARTTILIEGTS
jgi:hypothetical protein